MVTLAWGALENPVHQLLRHVVRAEDEVLRWKRRT